MRGRVMSLATALAACSGGAGAESDAGLADAAVDAPLAVDAAVPLVATEWVVDVAETQNLERVVVLADGVLVFASPELVRIEDDGAEGPRRELPLDYDWALAAVAGASGEVYAWYRVDGTLSIVAFDAATLDERWTAPLTREPNVTAFAAASDGVWVVSGVPGARSIWRIDAAGVASDATPIDLDCPLARVGLALDSGGVAVVCTPAGIGAVSVHEIDPSSGGVTEVGTLADPSYGASAEVAGDRLVVTALRDDDAVVSVLRRDGSWAVSPTVASQDLAQATVAGSHFVDRSGDLVYAALFGDPATVTRWRVPTRPDAYPFDGALGSDGERAFIATLDNRYTFDTVLRVMRLAPLD